MYESPVQAQQNIRWASLDFYTVVWGFMIKEIHFDNGHTAPKVLCSLCDSDNIQKFEGQCKSLEDRVEKEAQNCDRRQIPNCGII